MKMTTAVTLALSLGTVFGAGPAQAQHGGGAWCTERPIGSWGFPNCSYSLFQQCQATAWGTRAHCRPNPWLGYAEAPRRKYRARRHR
jgi:Protein of unknown function (DUF3551)